MLSVPRVGQTNSCFKEFLHLHPHKSETENGKVLKTKVFWLHLMELICKKKDKIRLQVVEHNSASGTLRCKWLQRTWNWHSWKICHCEFKTILHTWNLQKIESKFSTEPSFAFPNIFYGLPWQYVSLYPYLLLPKARQCVWHVFSRLHAGVIVPEIISAKPFQLLIDIKEYSVNYFRKTQLMKKKRNP